MPYPSDTMNNLFWFVQVSVFNKNVIFMKIVAGNFNCALTVVNAFMNCTMFFKATGHSHKQNVILSSVLMITDQPGFHGI